jgi:CBS domain-containing protein
MEWSASLKWAPTLEEAIEKNPLTVSPTMPLTDVIALLSQASFPASSHDKEATSGQPSQTSRIRTNCVLVKQENTLLGIFTARDVVRLTAQGSDFAKVCVAEVMTHPVITLQQQLMQDIFAPLFLFRRYQIRHLPIVDEQGQLVGLISHESIRQTLRPANLLRFRRVSDVMTTPVVQAPITASVLHLAQLMTDHRVSCVVIMHPEDGEQPAQPIGIITERDIVQFQAFQLDLLRTQALTVMSTPLFLLSPEDSLWVAQQEMQKRRVGRLVVSWNWGYDLGIVTQTNVLRVFDPMEMYSVIETLQQTIHQLVSERPLGDTEPSSVAAALEPVPLNPTDRALVHLLDHGLGGSRDRLFSLLQRASQVTESLITSPHLSAKRRQARLNTILKLVEQLKQALHA